MTKRILPSPELLRQLLDYDPDTGKLFWKVRPRDMFSSDRIFNSWNSKMAGKEAFTADSNGYLVGRIFDVLYFSHRVIWAMIYGNWPDLDIDHVNRDGRDNRIVNLRLATDSENLRNIGLFKSNKSGYKGVSWCKRNEKWVARVSTGKEYKYLGCFVTPELASQAYKEAARIYHGEFYAET